MNTTYLLWIGAVLVAALAAYTHTYRSGRDYTRTHFERRRRYRAFLTVLLLGTAVLLAYAGWDAR